MQQESFADSHHQVVATSHRRRRRRLVTLVWLKIGPRNCRVALINSLCALIH